ncbi:MAG: hypothetical protein ACC628_03040 [Pirellulaceae bacterium]
MRMCDLNTGVIRLTRSAKTLRDHWLDAKEHWNDRNSREFEQTHLEPLAPEITLTLAAVQRLAEVLEQAECECSEETLE